jgi:hypothetical protein
MMEELENCPNCDKYNGKLKKMPLQDKKLCLNVECMATYDI